MTLRMAQRCAIMSMFVILLALMSMHSITLSLGGTARM